MALDFLLGTSGDVRSELSTPAELEVSANDIDRARNRATAIVNSYVESAYPGAVPFSAVTKTSPLLLPHDAAVVALTVVV